MLQYHDRRITEQLILHWNQLRKERLFPTIEELDSENLVQIWPDCYILVLDAESSAGFRFKYLGDNIRHFVSGKSIIDKELSRRLWQSFRTILETKKPVVEESELTLSENEVIKYRTILLPLGPDEEKVDHVFGGIRFRVFDASETENIHSLLVEPDPYASELMAVEKEGGKKAQPQTMRNPTEAFGDVSQFMRPGGNPAGAVSAPTASGTQIPPLQQAGQPSVAGTSEPGSFMSPAEYKKQLEQQHQAASTQPPAASTAPVQQPEGSSATPPAPPIPAQPEEQAQESSSSGNIPPPPPPPVSQPDKEESST